MSLVDYNDYELMMAEVENAPRHRVILCEHCGTPFDVELRPGTDYANFFYCDGKASAAKPMVYENSAGFAIWLRKRNQIVERLHKRQAIAQSGLMRLLNG